MSCMPSGPEDRDSAPSTLAQIVMPQQPRRDRTVRPPRASPPRERNWRRPRPQLPEIAHGLQQREVGGGKDIRAAQREEQIALSGPRPDATQRIKCRIRIEVGQRRERGEIDRLLFHLYGERGQVRGLLSRDAERTQTAFTQARDVRRRQRPGRLRDALVHRASLRERDLLLEHEQHQGLEAWLAWPQWW